MAALGIMENKQNTLYWIILSIATIIALIVLIYSIWWTGKIADVAKPQTDALRKELGA